MSKQENPRPTIGLIINHLDRSYQLLLWNAIEDTARELDLNIMCYPGCDWLSPEPEESTRNKIYNLISPDYIDGLIIATTVMANYVNKEILINFCRRFKPIPTVSIGVPIDGIPSIVSDNEEGLRSLIDHLILVHHYRKFLYIGGTQNNIEAQIRLSIFESVLQKHNIAVDPLLVKVGNFSMEEAKTIVNNVLNDKLDFQAIVAANDDMAIGAIEALQERGLILPDQFAVTGYDDIPSSRFLALPLTTVRQPIQDTGRLAITTLLKMINKTEVSMIQELKSEVVFRRSCGCFSREAFRAQIQNIVPVSEKYLESFETIKESVNNEIKIEANQANIKVSTNWFNYLLDSFYNELTGKTQRNSFLFSFEKIIRSSAPSNIELTLWQNFISCLHNNSLPYLENDNQLLLNVENMLHPARVLIKEKAEQLQNSQRLQANKMSKDLQIVFNQLASSYDIESLLKAMITSLPVIGIKSCYLSLYKNTDVMKREARFFMGYNENGRLYLNLDGYIFPDVQLFPRSKIEIERRYNMIVEGLIYKEDFIGFTVLEINPNDGILSHFLSQHIRNALKVSMQNDIIKENEKSIDEIKLKNMMIKNKMRDNELQFKENQQRLLNSEKMAMIGRLSTGIIQDMNMSISAVRSSLLELKKLIQIYAESSDEDFSLQSNSTDIITAMQSTLKLADFAANQITGFIHNIKAQTREIKPNEKHLFNLTQTIQETLLLLNYALKSVNCRVDFIHDERAVMINGQPAYMIEIFLHLITNSIDALQNKDNGLITIDLKKLENEIELIIKDNGCGISAEHLSKVFNPLYTTKSLNHGSGLGLTIVQDIISREFDGIIQIQSTEGVGTTVTLNFQL